MGKQHLPTVVQHPYQLVPWHGTHTNITWPLTNTLWVSPANAAAPEAPCQAPPQFQPSPTRGLCYTYHTDTGCVHSPACSTTVTGIWLSHLSGNNGGGPGEGATPGVPPSGPSTTTSLEANAASCMCGSRACHWGLRRVHSCWRRRVRRRGQQPAATNLAALPHVQCRQWESTRRRLQTV